MNDTYTISQVRDYVEGHLFSSSDITALSLNEIKAMLHNALICIDCEQDGLAAMVKRKKFYAKAEAQANIVEELKKQFSA